MADKKISQLTAATTPLAGSEVLPIVQSSTTVKVSVADVTKGRTIQTTGINDNNNNEVITIATTASAVNELTVANAAAAANPVISATGDDTNIGITLTPKGTGNAVLTSGNLVVANGNGIDFSATSSGSGTMTSELLADYEEGTWTPVYTAGVATFTYASYKYGKYIRVGNVVHIVGRIATNSISGGSAGNLVYIAGLPFANAANSQVGVSLIFAGAFNSNTPCAGFINFGSTDCLLHYRATSVSSVAATTYADLLNGSDKNDIIFQFSYTV